MIPFFCLQVIYEISFPYSTFISINCLKFVVHDSSWSTLNQPTQHVLSCLKEKEGIATNEYLNTNGFHMQVLQLSLISLVIVISLSFLISHLKNGRN